MQKDHTVLTNKNVYMFSAKPTFALYTLKKFTDVAVACCSGSNMQDLISFSAFLSILFLDEQKDSVMPSETWGHATAASLSTQMVPLHK